MLEARSPELRGLDLRQPLRPIVKSLYIEPPAYQSGQYRQEVARLRSEIQRAISRQRESSKQLDVLAIFTDQVLPGIVTELGEFNEEIDPTAMFVRVANVVAPQPTRSLSPAEISRLENWLGKVEDRRIMDKTSFVDAINRMLKASNLRIIVPSGHQCLLRAVSIERTKKGAEPYTYIRFTSSGGMARGRLGKMKVSLQPAASTNG
jgi:hypothetical protein